jgi:tetratricopeptide (TPR) repeat protein
MAALALSHLTELRWAASGLPSYMMGGVPSLPEIELLDQAGMGMDAGADARWVRVRLMQSFQVDPNSRVHMALGEQYRREGKLELALEHLTRFLELDPTDLFSYVRIAEIHQAAGRERERRQIIEQGIAYFQSHLEEQWPRLDETVEQKFNERSVSVYRGYQKSLRALRTRL